MRLPGFITRVSNNFIPAFTTPTYNRFLILLLAAILTIGRKTISNLLRTVGNHAEGHWSSFNRFLSAAKWNEWKLSKILIDIILKKLVPKGRVFLAIDDTVAEHPGKKVWGKGRHRDAVRSSHSYTTYLWGHKWVVISIVLKLPFSNRHWALPIMACLYRSRDWNKENGMTHRTPAEIAQLMLAKIIKWFPSRYFVVVGDSGFGTSAMARFCSNNKKHLMLVSKFYSDAALHEAPTPNKMGRPRKVGKKLDSPEKVVAKTKRMKKLKVSWYGGGDREVGIVAGIGYWYRFGYDIVEVLWVYVHDYTGTHRDEYFFTTNVTLKPRQVIEYYTSRWSIETTFQEVREHLKLQSPKNYCRMSVKRTTPCLFGLYSIIILLYLEIPKKYHNQSQITWLGKNQISFSDIVASVRRAIWVECFFQTPAKGKGFKKLPRSMQNTILNALAPAA